MSTSAPSAAGSAASYPILIDSKSSGDVNADVLELVSKHRKYFGSDATRGMEWRKRQLKQLRALVVNHESELCAAIHSDLGRAPFESWLLEIQMIVEEIDTMLANVAAWAKPTKVSTNLLNEPAWSYQYHDPYGLTLIIAPWNYPIQLLLVPLVGAIGAGNCCVMKPSEVAPATMDIIAKLVPRYLDTDAFSVCAGGVETSVALLAQKWDFIFFTGSGMIGKKVLASAAPHLTPTVLELGGKSPTIVLADADLDLAARRIAWGKFTNTGQTCIAPDYVMVEQAVQDKFLSRLTHYITEFYTADPKTSVDYARVINQNHTRRLSALLQPQANVKPWRVVTGGLETVDVANRYIAPTVLADVSFDHTVMADEIFGPILPVITVSGVEEVISNVNRYDRPLALYVFTSSSKKSEQILTRTSSGGACVNEVLLHVANPSLPFGGVGPSGVGAYHGKKTFETFSHSKSVLYKANSIGDVPFRYPPFNTSKQSVMRKLVGVQAFTEHHPLLLATAAFALVGGITAILVTKFAAPGW